MAKKKVDPIKPGKLIVIDGNDGSGKSTQVRLLIDTLEKSGHQTARVKFPQHGHPSAYFTDNYLAGKYGWLNAQAITIMFALDRFDASFKIRDLLNQGIIVIADRYVTSAAAHEGSFIKDQAQRIKFFRWLNNLEYGTFNLPRPDLNIILHVPHTISEKLRHTRRDTTGRQDDIHESSPDHLRSAERVFLEIANLFPNTKLVECAYKGKLLAQKQVHAKVWELVRRIALRG